MGPCHLGADTGCPQGSGRAIAPCTTRSGAHPKGGCGTCGSISPSGLVPCPPGGTQQKNIETRRCTSRSNTNIYASAGRGCNPTPCCCPPDGAPSVSRVCQYLPSRTLPWLFGPFPTSSPPSRPIAANFLWSTDDRNRADRFRRLRVCNTHEHCPPCWDASPGRGHHGLIMYIPLSNPSRLATTSLACPICSNTFSKRKDLLYHLRTSTDDNHKTFRDDASAPATAT
jgi:hypothetical protein